MFPFGLIQHADYITIEKCRVSASFVGSWQDDNGGRRTGQDAGVRPSGKHGGGNAGKQPTRQQGSSSISHKEQVEYSSERD